MNLESLRKLCEKATAGPWEWDGIAYVWGGQQMIADLPEVNAVIRMRGVGGKLPIADNAAFIAAALSRHLKGGG